MSRQPSHSLGVEELDGPQGRTSVVGSKLSFSPSKARPDIKGHVVPKMLSHTTNSVIHGIIRAGRAGSTEKGRWGEGDSSLCCEGWLGICWAGKGVPDGGTNKSQGPEE